MSREVAAAMLTQVYFASSLAAQRHVDKEVNADSSKGAAPAKGAVGTVVAVYNEILNTLPKPA